MARSIELVDFRRGDLRNRAAGVLRAARVAGISGILPNALAFASLEAAETSVEVVRQSRDLVGQIILVGGQPSGVALTVDELSIQHPADPTSELRGRCIDLFHKQDLEPAEQDEIVRRVAGRAGYEGLVLAFMNADQQPYAGGIPRLMPAVGEQGRLYVPDGAEDYGLNSIGKPLQVYARIALDAATWTSVE
ncbi:MAG TPA: hypothetical protein VLF69_01900 [Candidatus Saccharimonadales bacterium]|nr:hypothetical protein [Candidatus Saccharimonadales bacterium]